MVYTQPIRLLNVCSLGSWTPSKKQNSWIAVHLNLNEHLLCCCFALC